MKIKAIAAGVALALSVGAAGAYAQPGTTLPTHQVPLIEYDNQQNNGPLTVWPRGLYDTVAECLKARKALIGPTHQYLDPGAPYAVLCCSGPSGNRCQVAALEFLN